MRNPQFHIQSRDFIEQLIRQRRYLIRSGRSKADTGYMNSCMEELDKYLKAYPYNTDQTMSVFWVRHSDSIFAIIPGRNAGGHEAAMQLYHHFNAKARYLVETSSPWWQSLMVVSPN